jgi:ribosomal protein S18 acetylase RimI-like enzyme
VRGPATSAGASPDAGLQVRAIAPADLPAARALIAAELSNNPYATRALDLVDALEPAGEYQGVVAEEGGRLVGVGVFGLVAGSQGAGSLYAAAVDPAYRRRGVGRALVRAATDALRSLGARFVIVEVPDDPAATAPFVELVAASGFTEAARVPDLYRDGVALAFWRQTL